MPTRSRPARRRAAFLVVALAAAVLPAAGARAVPETVPDLPLLGAESRSGALGAARLPDQAPSAKTVDGSVADWTGESTGFGGTARYSRGEYVYQDYVFDDHGPDDGWDAQRLAVLDPLREAEPRTYRLDALFQAAGNQFGAPTPPAADEPYGDASYPTSLREADLVELRLAASETDLFVMARTGAMRDDAPGTALLLLLGDRAGGPAAAVPFNAGLTSTAQLAVFLSAQAAQWRDLGSGAQGALTDVAVNASGFTNVVEARIPLSLLAAGSMLKVAAATGLADGASLREVAAPGANLYNAAFRFAEPARVWMDREQALALGAGSMDAFTPTLDLAQMRAGRTDAFVPRPGYYERVFESTTPGLAVESGTQGRFQHYGLYLPETYRHGTPSPATWWLHWRGGKAHSAAAWIPTMFRHLGDQRGNVVISPSARGTSTWYLGKGHADFLEVWDDAMTVASIDASRVYVSGYSMGGFGSYLLGLLYPDRFAAAFPIVGPPTCGAFVNEHVPPVGTSECRSPGYSEAQNAARLLTFDILENARNLPYVMFLGTADELVPIAGTERQSLRFAELGYRYRSYAFAGYEHYTFAVIDQWKEGARYLDQFVRDPAPARVTYRVSPGMEDAVETVQTNGTPFDFTFDGAYWISGMRARPGARFGTADVTTLGRGAREPLVLPEAGVASPDHAGVYAMHGLRWERGEWRAAADSFEGTVTDLAAITLDRSGMGLGSTFSGRLTVKGGDVEVTVTGVAPGTSVRVDGAPVTTMQSGDAVRFTVPGNGVRRIDVTG